MVVDEERDVWPISGRESRRITRFQHTTLLSESRLRISLTLDSFSSTSFRVQSYGSLGLARVRLFPTETFRRLSISIRQQTDSATLRIYLGFYYAFRALVPLPQHRTPWAWSNAYWAVLPLVPLLFMAYLVRRKDTFVMRLLLLPATVCLLLHSAHGYVYLSIPGILG